MNISRLFLLTGTTYLLIGMIIGSYMGASADRTLTPVHAHANLLGFTLMVVFALIYKAYPAMAASILARLHFWIHQIGVLFLLVALFLFYSGTVDLSVVEPVLMVTSLIVPFGTLVLLLNLYRNAH